MSAWTTEPPAESGCYWWREDANSDFEMFVVFKKLRSRRDDAQEEE